jgi:hypothetical protein
MVRAACECVCGMSTRRSAAVFACVDVVSVVVSVVVVGAVGLSATHLLCVLCGHATQSRCFGEGPSEVRTRRHVWRVLM